MEHMRAMTAITNPIVNSYKRLVPGYEAPTYIAWSATNRSPLVRVPAARGVGTRVELRCPDCAANPYLTLAVCLAAGLDGIKRGLVPKESVQQDIYSMTSKERDEAGIENLPKNLYEAVQEMKKSSFVKNVLGKETFDKYVYAKESEWMEYTSQVTDWENMVENLRHPDKTVKIAMVGKYTQLHDAYLSVVEALKHGGISCRAKVDIVWVDSEELNEKNLDQTLHSVDGILVPGGFGNRGTEGMILAAQYARVHKIPYLGICLGMQMAIVEFARHVLGYEDANSIELAPETTHPVIALMPDQEDVEDLGGTLRLGSYPCVLAEGSKSYELFGKKEIQERHRHRYEVNNAFRKELSEKGMSIVGTSPDAHIVEMIEIAGHPFFVGTQGHPEFKSRPNHAHPLFRGFVQAAVDKKTAEEAAMKG